MQRRRMSPQKLQSLLQAGLAHHRAGRLPEAELHYRQARAGAPKNFDALHLSGLAAYQLGRMAEAADWLGRAHRLNPQHAVCAMRHGLALIALRRLPEAEQLLRHAVAAKADLPEAWDNLAYCLKLQDRLAEAVGCHETAVKLKPDYAVGWYNFGLTLNLLGREADALRCHDRALAADPDYAMARYGRAQALHKAHRMREAVAAYGDFLKLKPQHHEARSYRLFALQNLEDVPRETLLAEHRAYGQAVGAEVPRSWPNAPDPARRLRVAIFSPDLRAHSCAYFLEPLLRHLDRTAFDLVLYHDHFREDAVSARLRSLASVWRNFIGVSAADVEAAIRADAPDVLVDLAGHTGMTNRLPLFARRLAPVQITYLGYPDTTGVPAMDYRFSDDAADPAGEADRFCTEELIRFSDCAWTYAAPADAPDVSPGPAAGGGGVVFGCFNNLSKVTDRTLRLWAGVLGAVPDARLLCKSSGLDEADGRARLEARLGAAGVPVGRVDLLGRTDDTRSHLALYGRVDIALDTTPYHGTTTTCEALWMGVPVVSRYGDRHAARVGASLLRAVGHPEWSVATDADYVSTAVRLASDRAQLAAVRAGLRAQVAASVLCDHAGQAQRFAGALRSVWARWCARQTARAA